MTERDEDRIRGRNDFLSRDAAMRQHDQLGRPGKCTGKTPDGRNHDNGLRSRQEIALTIAFAEVQLDKKLAEIGTRPMPWNRCPVPECGVKLTKLKKCPIDEDHTPDRGNAEDVLRYVKE